MIFCEIHLDGVAIQWVNPILHEAACASPSASARMVGSEDRPWAVPQFSTIGPWWNQYWLVVDLPLWKMMELMGPKMGFNGDQYGMKTLDSEH